MIFNHLTISPFYIDNFLGESWKYIFMTFKIPKDPSEPDVAKGDRIVTKVIPLEDMSREEAYTDYSCQPWPQVLQEVEATVDSAIQPHLLQTVMGGLPLPETSNTSSLAMDAALYAAQKAAEAELRKQGALPSLEDEDTAMEEPTMDHTVPQPFKQPEYLPGGPNNMDFYKYAPPASWYSSNGYGEEQDSWARRGEGGEQEYSRP